MSDVIIRSLAWQSMVIFFIWAPFALAAFVIEHWHHPIAQRWRASVAHPLRARQRHEVAWGHG
jgi:hypothetical protein